MPNAFAFGIFILKTNDMSFSEFITANKSKVLADAVELTKQNFIELYVDRGFDEFDVGRAWHDLRRTSQGQDMIATIYGQRSGYVANVAYEVPDSEFEKQVEYKEKIKKVKKEAKANPDNAKVIETIMAPKVGKIKKPSRLDQVRKLYESGITSPKQIAEELGTNTSYVHRLLTKVKNG